jgi:hypothetical protein
MPGRRPVVVLVVEGVVVPAISPVIVVVMIVVMTAVMPMAATAKAFEYLLEEAHGSLEQDPQGRLPSPAWIVRGGPVGNTP